MANPEHLEMIEKGVAEWNEWRRLERDVTPNLVAANLCERNLIGIDLSGALLDGADFRKSDMRESILESISARSADFSQADLAGADLSHSRLQETSFNGTVLARIRANNADFSNAYISDCDMSNSNCDYIALSHAKVSRVSFSGSSLEHGILVESSFLECRFGDSRLSSINLTGAQFRSCNLDRSILSGATLNRTSIIKCSLCKARLDGAYIEDTSFSEVNTTDIDLSCAVLIRPSLVSFNLSTAILFDTRIIAPSWPIRPVRATWVGTPVLSSTLFSHPVQDIKGLSPEIRRIVANAQLIREYWQQSAERVAQRLLIRFWGISCNYGQSIIRWMIFTSCILTACAVTLTTSPFYIPEYEEIYQLPQSEASHSIMHTHATNSDETQQIGEITGNTSRKQTSVSSHIVIAKPSLFRAFCFSATMFTTLGFSDMTPASKLGHIMVVIMVLIGYAMLGTLISILTTKLARLS